MANTLKYFPMQVLVSYSLNHFYPLFLRLIFCRVGGKKIVIVGNPSVTAIDLHSYHLL